jgi:O-antigen/teichoic acid export membrane protein
MTAIARAGRRTRTDSLTGAKPHTTGVPWLLAVELGSSAVGFAVIVHLARALGVSAFAHVEYATAIAAWLLVLVRGGVEVIVYREAARKPRLVHSLTEVVIGMRCLFAILGYILVLIVAWLVGPERRGTVAVAGLVLLPAAFVADVGPRATGRLGWIAAAQALRALGYASAGFLLVTDSSHALRAAACGVVGEVASWIVPFAHHAHRYGVPRPRSHPRACAVLAHRGAITSLIRFGRVGLYGADLLVLGWWAGGELGPYAAARRLVFALVALGLVVPSAVAPAIARTWLTGVLQTRSFLGDVSTLLWSISLPACVGLAITASRWMPLLFGAGYAEGGPWLALVGLRLPFLLSASLSQAALVACRRETDALTLVLGLLVLAAVLLPTLAAWAGPAGVGSAALVVELAAAGGGRLFLSRLGVAPAVVQRLAGPLVGTLVLALVCTMLRKQPIWVVCGAGAIAYSMIWTVEHRRTKRVSVAGVWMS